MIGQHDQQVHAKPESGSDAAGKRTLRGLPEGAHCIEFGGVKRTVEIDPHAPSVQRVVLQRL